MIFVADQQKCPHEYALYLRHRGSYSYPHSGHSSLEEKKNEKTELIAMFLHSTMHGTTLVSCLLDFISNTRSLKKGLKFYVVSL